MKTKKLLGITMVVSFLIILFYACKKQDLQTTSELHVDNTEFIKNAIAQFLVSYAKSSTVNEQKSISTMGGR